jgi:hypothetical protein
MSGLLLNLGEFYWGTLELRGPEVKDGAFVGGTVLGNGAARECAGAEGLADAVAV